MTETETETIPNETHDWEAERAEAYRQALTRFREEADRDNPPAWVGPDKGKGAELQGWVREIKEPSIRTAWGNSPPVLEIEDESQPGTFWSLWLWHKVLLSKCARLKPEPGERIYVRYDGVTKPEKGGPPYEDYTVLVDRPKGDTKFDWDPITRQVDPDDERWRDVGEPASDTSLADDAEDIPF